MFLQLLFELLFWNREYFLPSVYYSFVQMFSGQSIAFGKTEKLIKCEILKPVDPSFEGLPYDGYSSGSEATYTFLEEDEDEDEGEDDDNDQNDTYLNSENLTLEKHVKHMETIEAKVVARASSYEEETKAVKKMPKLTNQTEVTHKPARKPIQKTNKKQNLK